MSTTPTAVQKQLEEAEKMHKETYGKPEDGKTNDGKTSPKKAETPLAPEKTETPPPQPKSKEILPEDTSPSESVPPVPENEIEKLKQSFSVLQGKYNAEVPRLYGMVQDLTKENESLKTENEKLKMATPPTPKLSSEGLKRLTDEYGEDFVKDMQALFKEEARTEAEIIAKDVVKPFGEKLENVSHQTTMTARDRFLKDLTDAVSNWQIIKNDPAFLEYLSGIEEFSGRVRYDLASEAQDALDAQRVAAFYKDFANKTGKSLSTPEKNPTVPTGGSSKAALLTPNASTSVTKVADNEVPYVTAQEIQQFGEDMKLERYKGREADAQAMQKKIDNAIAKRRVIG